jgi:hypothetical protein
MHGQDGAADQDRRARPDRHAGVAHDLAADHRAVGATQIDQPQPARDADLEPGVAARHRALAEPDVDPGIVFTGLPATGDCSRPRRGLAARARDPDQRRRRPAAPTIQLVRRLNQPRRPTARRRTNIRKKLD